MHALNTIAMIIGYTSVTSCFLLLLFIKIRHLNKPKKSTKDFYQGKHIFNNNSK